VSRHWHTWSFWRRCHGFSLGVFRFFSVLTIPVPILFFGLFAAPRLLLVACYLYFFKKFRKFWLAAPVWFFLMLWHYNAHCFPFWSFLFSNFLKYPRAGYCYPLLTFFSSKNPIWGTILSNHSFVWTLLQRFLCYLLLLCWSLLSSKNCAAGRIFFRIFFGDCGFTFVLFKTATCDEMSSQIVVGRIRLDLLRRR